MVANKDNEHAFCSSCKPFFSVLLSDISKNEENIVWFASLDMSFLKIANCVNFSTNCGRKDCKVLPLAVNMEEKIANFD